MAGLSFLDWLDEDRPSIWDRDRNNKVFGMSAHFRKMLRPIFFKAYHCIRFDGRSYRYPDFLAHVRIQNDGSVTIPDPPNERLASDGDVKDIIMALETSVRRLCHRERVNPLPTVVSCFFSLCSEARNCNDLATLRKYAFYITLNPVIYNMDEWNRFRDKIWFIYKVSKPAFEYHIWLNKMTEFPTAIRQNPASSLYKVYTEDERKLYPGQPLTFLQSEQKYPRKAATRFMGDLFRHSIDIVSQGDLVREVQECLPGYVPALFEEVVLKYCIHPKLPPAVIFGRGNDRSLIARMQQFPLVFNLNDLELDRRRIAGDLPITLIHQ